MLSDDMEHELRLNLFAVAEAYAQASGLGLSTIGRLAARDGSFFDRISDDANSFTARKYDDVMVWFSENWPDHTPWPPAVERPQRQQAAS